MSRKKHFATPRIVEIDGAKYEIRPTAGWWIVSTEPLGEYLTTIYQEGSQYVSSGFPGKKWGSIKQTIQYVVTMRRQ